jgi:hypothetical protein
VIEKICYWFGQNTVPLVVELVDLAERLIC